MEINSIIIWVHTRHKGAHTRERLSHSLRAKWNFEWLLILMRALAPAARRRLSECVFVRLVGFVLFSVCTLLSIQIITARCQSICSYAGFTFGRIWQFVVVVEEVVTK